MNNHGILYRKARSVFGCRVKRVWFQLNPFLERTNVKEDELGIYQPSSKFVLPLQSIVLCEDLNSESVPDWQELSPAAFWDYLYSSSWGEECSLRVMEGELLELLLTSLFTLEREQQVVSHNTFAYSTNTRMKPSCCKTGNSDKSESTIDETLIIEFTYFGKRIRPLDPDFSGTTAYPFSLTSSRGLTSSDYTSSSLESSDPPSIAKPTIQNLDIVKPEDKVKDYTERSPRSVKFDSVNIKIVDSGLLGIKGPLRAIPVTALANVSPFDNSGSVLIKSFMKESTQLLAKHKPSTPHVKDKFVNIDLSSQTPRGRGSVQPNRKMPPLFEGKGKRANTSDANPGGGSEASDSALDNSDSSDTGLHLLEFNLAKLPCSEKATAGLENWQLDKYAYIRRPPGEEYYLRINDNQEKLSSREKLLRKRKRIQEEREERQREAEERQKFYAKTPNKATEVKADDIPMKPVVKFFDHNPSFMEFLQWLEEENKFDPRYKKNKQRKKKMVKKYKLHISHIDFTTSSRLNVRRSSIDVQSAAPGDSSSTKIKVSGKRRMTLTGPITDMITQRFAEEAGGVTDSPAVKTTLLNSIQDQEVEEELAPLGGHVSRRQSRPRRLPVSTEPKILLHGLEEDNLHRTSVEIKDKLSGLQPSLPPLIEKKSATTVHGPALKVTALGARTKAKSGMSLHKKNEFKIPGRELDLETESADTESEGDDEQEESLFDSNKLNKRYSFEKLRGKNYHKKKPIFSDILKKYYRVQKAMNAIKGPTKGAPIIADQKAALGGKKQAASLLKRLSLKPTKPKVDIVLGKLKSFGFQKYNNHKPKVPDVNLPDFTTYQSKEFMVNLAKALDDFVVRKENVISSFGLETLTTVTFTRSSVFSKMLHVD